MELYSRTRARRGLIYTIGFRALSQLATMVSYVVLVRGLSEQALGIYSLLYSVVPIVGTAGSLGLDQVLKRFQPEYLRSGDLMAASWLVRIVTAGRFASNLVLLAIILVGWDLVSRPFHLTNHRQDFELFSVIVLLYFQVTLLQISLASHMLQGYSVGAVAVLSISKLITYWLVYQFIGFTLHWAILADSVSFLATYAFLLVAHWRLCPAPQGVREFRPPPTERKRLWRYALANNFNEGTSLLLYVQTDNFFIAALMSPLSVGAYAFYARLNEMFSNLIPTRLFENVIQPLFFSTSSERAAERLPKYVTLLINISMAIQWPLFAFSLVFHRELITLVFHGKFLDYSSLLPVVVGFGLTNNVISTPITMTALHAERASLILKSQLFAIYQVVAMLVLVPLFGLYGAAVATGTMHLLRNLWVWWHVRSSARWSNFRAAATTGVAIWVVAIVLCYLVRSVLTAMPLLDMVLGGLICAIATLCYLRSSAICASDREILGGVLHGRESRALHWFGLAPRVTE